MTAFPWYFPQRNRQMIERAPSIVVVGSANVDMIVHSDRLPGPGETVVGGDFLTAGGGKGANQAVMARRLGAKVAVINCLGSDVFGDMTIENFRSEGIDVSHITRTAEVSSGVAPIWVEPNGDKGSAFFFELQTAEAAVLAHGNIEPGRLHFRH